MRDLIIGVDGGASGTQAVVADMNGQVLGKYLAGASNIHAVGENGAAMALDAVVSGVLRGTSRSLSDVAVIALGLAGLNHAVDRVVYESIIGRLNWGDPEVILENDVVIAWAGATRCRPGLALIAGTGCNAFGINAKGERWKASGWDYLLADEGSAYWIGLQGLRAAMRAYDGRGPETLLMQAVKDEYHLAEVPDLLRVVYSPDFGKTITAAFARRVSACADKGDAAAQGILREAGEELALAANAVIRRLGMADEEFDIGLTGGVSRSGGIVRKTFDAAVHAVAPKAHIALVEYPPAIGALFLALYRSGRLTDELVQRIETSSGDLLAQIQAKG